MWETFKLIGSAILGGIITLYLPFFRQLVLGPKLKLYFDKEFGCVAKTPIELTTIIDNKIVKTKAEGYYIRVKVKNIKSLLARDCRAFLVNIEKLNAENKYQSTIYIDSIQAQWASRSGQGFQGIDIPKGINQFVDIFATINGSNNLDFKLEVKPFRYEELFQEHGIFRYTVQVSGNEVAPKFIKFIFHWKGQWDDFDAYIDPDSLLEDKNWVWKLSKFFADIRTKGEKLWASREDKGEKHR